MAVHVTSKSPSKTSELIIYIAHKLKDKANFGATLLGKSLYLIDCTSYLKTGKPISDLNYIKQEFGPTPDPAKFLPIRTNLILSNDLASVPTVYFGKKVEKYVANRKPEVAVFTKDEIALINDVIDSIEDFTAAELSAYTHELPAWKAADKMEELPFYSYLLTHKEPNEKVLKWANKVMKSYIRKQNSSK